MTPFIMIAGIVLLVAVATSLLWREAHLREVDARVFRAINNRKQDPAHAQLMRWVRALGDRCRRFYSPGDLEHLRSMILASGFNPHRALPVVLGGKLTVMLLLPALSVLVAVSFVTSLNAQVLLIVAGVILGVMGPEWILGVMRRRFVAALERGTPDALDLLIVCSEAGMGLESAVERVAHEMQVSNPAIASILSSLLNDLRVLPNRRDAFLNLGTRSGVDGLRRVGTMLSQSMSFGTPLGDTLRAVASELRRERMNKLEEKAVKLPAMLIFPLIFFIMPALYIVLLGPSFTRLHDVLTFALAH